MTPLARAYVGIGSNLESPVAQVRRGVAALERLPDSRLVGCSSLYRSAPVGITEQPDFINAACALDTTLEPRALMQRLLEIESAHGRTRGPTRGGPRTLDLDLLLYGELELASPELTLPHPRLHERAFMLYPLFEIAPTLDVPGRGAVATLLERCDKGDVVRLPPDASDHDHWA
ncbi:MAG: 2-amino-4-hydroxy-6-hydroxymethyldihydropteridine diphosphokinase [Sulfurifustaceae bacterium]